MVYGVSDHLHDHRFISENESNNDVINHHLQITHNFDVIKNIYKFYLPNPLRNNGYVETYQVVYIDYKLDFKIYKPKKSKKKSKQVNEKGGIGIKNHCMHINYYNNL